MNAMRNNNFNYIEHLVKQYVRDSHDPNFSFDERQDSQRYILIELFSKFGFIYSSDGKCDVF